LRQPTIPPSALEAGFRLAPASTHTGRTIMLRELSLLLEASPRCASYDDLQRLVVDENVTLKATQAGRKESFRRLRELYGLRRQYAVYLALRDLWTARPDEQPLLAMLCALSRDSLLRATAPVILDQPVDAVLTPQMIAEALRSQFPDQFSPIISAAFGRHALSSWTQSGHAAGRLRKTRTKACIGPASTAYALFLGYLCGARGTGLFETLWAETLDSSPAEIDAQAFAASQRGWIDYRRMGDVVDIGFTLLRKEQVCTSGVNGDNALLHS